MTNLLQFVFQANPQVAFTLICANRRGKLASPKNISARTAGGGQETGSPAASSHL